MGTKSVWFVLGGVVLWGQSLRLERSDSRTEFVTAGERFCVVVRAWDATLYGAGCRLRYTPASLVKFAGWSTVNFARSELFVVADTDTQVDEGIVDIAALSIRQAYLNPAIVVLEFVLSHDALHGGSIQFRGTEGWALISGGDSLRALPESRLTLSVHGYVTVWPGDANNDGNVDGRDVAVVGLYAHRKAIGYRRTPASTEWRPQKALAWVDPEATHADCDGNGVVSVRDVAVVLQNYGYNRDGFTRTAGLPPVELRSGDPLLWGRLPPDAEIVVGMITGCPGVRITGLRLAEPLEPLGIVVAEESLFVFVIVPQGSETLTILGQGPVCGALVEYRGGSGGWHQLEWQGLPVTEAPWGTDFQFRLRGEKMCLEGYRDLPGRVVVYSLLGQELAHFLVPPGEESWCTGLPLQGPAVCIATYWTPRGRSSSLLFVP